MELHLIGERGRNIRYGNQPPRELTYEYALVSRDEAVVCRLIQSARVYARRNNLLLQEYGYGITIHNQNSNSSLSIFLVEELERIHGVWALREAECLDLELSK